MPVKRGPIIELEWDPHVSAKARVDPAGGEQRFLPAFFFFSPLISKTVESFLLLLFFLSLSSSLSHFISSFTRKTTSGESSFLIVIHWLVLCKVLLFNRQPVGLIHWGLWALVYCNLFLWDLSWASDYRHSHISCPSLWAWTLSVVGYLWVFALNSVGYRIK